MDRDIVSDDANGILNDSVRDQIPVVTDPAQAEALLGALIEALSRNRNVRAEFRAGALWERKGRDAGGDFSPLVSPSPYRDLAGNDEVYLSVAVRIWQSNDAAALEAFVERQRAQSEQDLLAKLESESAALRHVRDAEQTRLDDLEARTAELRAAMNR
jgi:hypothetical protein